MPQDDDKVWVIGLDGPQDEDEDEGEGRGQGQGRGRGKHGDAPSGKGIGWGLLGAIAVGVVLGVGGWWMFLRPPAGPEPVHYTVVKGDSLSRIARRYGVDVASLRDWNDMEGDQIDVGQVLLLYPGGPAPEAGAGHRSGSRAGSHPRSNGGGGTVRAPEGSAPTAAALHMPAALPCRAGPGLSGTGDEPEMVASAGLSHVQTKGAMDAFTHNLERCLPPGGVDGTLVLELTVGCDGRVQEVQALDSEGLPAELVDCVLDTLRYAPFPAHDVADGFHFEYRMSIENAG